MTSIFKKVEGFVRKLGLTTLRALAGWLGMRVVGSEVETVPPGCRVIPASHMSFDPAVACAVGVNEAVAYQVVAAYSRLNEQKKMTHLHRQDRWWTFNLSYGEWQGKYFPWISEATVKRVFARLETAKLIVSQQLNAADGDNRKFYSPDTASAPTPFTLPLWGTQNEPMGGAACTPTSIDSSNSHSSRPKRQPTTAAHASRKGAVADFPAPRPDGELVEKRPPVGETPEDRDEHEPYTHSGDAPNTASAEDPSPSSAAPLPAAARELRAFGLELTDKELIGMVERYGEARLREEMERVRQKFNLQNPPGFLVAQLKKFPTGAPVVAAERGLDGAAYVAGEYGKWIKH